mmetsp:Transcript_34280/g.91575  ORF Transcript_34280/g.91575 Transcript_34280/m.91575 type:complete len:255 (+) Transcript_34280:2348-3112(+)
MEATQAWLALLHTVLRNVDLRRATEENPSIQDEVELHTSTVDSDDLFKHQPDGQGPLANWQRSHALFYGANDRLDESGRQLPLIPFCQTSKPALQVFSSFRIKAIQHGRKPTNDVSSVGSLASLCELRQWIEHGNLQLIKGSLTNRRFHVEDQRQDVVHPHGTDFRRGASSQQKCETSYRCFPHRDRLVSRKVRDEPGVEEVRQVLSFEAERRTKQRHHRIKETQGCPSYCRFLVDRGNSEDLGQIDVLSVTTF